MTVNLHLRPATPDDAEVLADLILQLAAYERLRHEARPDVVALRAHLHPAATPHLEALLAEDRETGQPLGFALFFPNYSTFLTRWGTWLEDLYVVPEMRGQGVGLALLREVAARTIARGGQRLDWSVLDWNTPAIDFYRRIGARPLDDWTTFRLTGEALQRLVEGH